MRDMLHLYNTIAIEVLLVAAWRCWYLLLAMGVCRVMRCESCTIAHTCMHDECLDEATAAPSLHVILLGQLGENLHHISTDDFARSM
jgi:hypothetical protein